MAKLRVGVLMGGISIEREVSFNSGRTVCDHLDTNRYTIIPLYHVHDNALYILPWKFLHRGKTSDFQHRLPTQAQKITWDALKTHIDFAYIAMHGRYAEDGILQGTLELLGIPYLGSSRLTSALCIDKGKTNTLLSYYDIPVARGITINAIDAAQISMHISSIIKQLKEQKIPTPWIIKPHNEGSSIGIAVVKKKDALEKAITAACYINGIPQAVMIEEYITGMEFSCITLFDYRNQTYLPLPPTEIVPESSTTLFDYDQKYMPGRALKFTPPRCSSAVTQQIQETCIRITQLFAIKTISRIDGFVTPDNRIVIIDVNTFSGMAPSSFVFREAAHIGMSHTDLINHLIETDLAHYGMLDQLEEHEKAEGGTMQKKKQTIAVLMGGASDEREISLESGRNVSYKLSPHKYNAMPIFVDQQMQLYRITQEQLVRNSTQEIAHTLTQDQRISWHELKKLSDFVFIALHGGAGENGSVQGMLEMLTIAYNGSSVWASALCMDKHKTATYLHAAGFDVPKQLLFTSVDWEQKKQNYIKTIEQTIGLPCIIKPNDDGCSFMVTIANNQEHIITGINAIFAAKKNEVLIEEKITGMELTVGVIGNENPRALPPSQTVTSHDILSIEEKFLPGAGENQTPAPLPEKTITYIERTLEQLYATVGLQGYARIDCFYQTAAQSGTGSERIIILEINSLPGLTPATCIFHQAAEINLKPMDFIDHIIALGLQAHHTKHQKRPTVGQNRKIAHTNRPE